MSDNVVDGNVGIEDTERPSTTRAGIGDSDRGRRRVDGGCCGRNTYGVVATTRRPVGNLVKVARRGKREIADLEGGRKHGIVGRAGGSKGVGVRILGVGVCRIADTRRVCMRREMGRG